MENGSDVDWYETKAKGCVCGTIVGTKKAVYLFFCLAENYLKFTEWIAQQAT